MRPLELSLEGFLAYRKLTRISFDDVELFAITGPTGSGKSSLLDAITFALYGRTPRMGGRGLGELRHPAAEMTRVALTFMLGERVFRVVRVLGARENQHRLEEQLAGQWRLLPESEKVRSLNEKLQALLGLSYEAFTRAILLPQGEFDLFLKGDATDRRELLSLLYGFSHMSDMREHAALHQREARVRLSRLEGELSGLSEVEPEKREAFDEALQTVARELAGCEAEYHYLEKAFKEVERTLALQKERNGLSGRREVWIGAEKAIERIRVLISAAQQSERIGPQLVTAKQAGAELAEASKLAEAARLELEGAQANIAHLQEAYDPGALEQLRLRLAQLPVLRGQEARLARLIRGSKVADIGMTITPLPFDEARIETLKEAERALEDFNALSLRRARLAEQLLRAEQAQERQEHDLKAHRGRLQELEASGKRARRAHQEAEQALATARSQAGLLAYHDLLQPGEACPLCKQMVTKLPDVVPVDLEPLERQEQEDGRRLEQIGVVYRELRGRVQTLNERLPEEQKRLGVQKLELSELDTQLERQESRIGGWRNLEQVELELAQRQKGLSDTLARATGGKSVAELERSLGHELREMETRKLELDNAVEHLQELQRRVVRTNTAHTEREHAWARQHQALKTALTQAGFASVEEAEQARLTLVERVALEGKLHAYQEEGAFLEGRLRQLEMEWAGREPQTWEAARRMKARMAELRSRQKQLGERKGEAQAWLLRFSRDLERKHELMSLSQAARRELDTWERVAEDLKGNRFPDYLLARYQLGLVRHASELLSTLSAGRYRFLAQEGDYYVLDLWTEAARPARTLSGGETFLASLSLALALSAYLSQGRLGALFLDEGFGSLDAETLELATSVLEALPTQGRLVGIVTHVAGLAERLPARLVVEKHPSGSTAHWVDESP